ncbi:hypothetical protein BDZ89DRAFT_1131529 [Hymenopellis radicata]|nr:hypothetical protein BDZ89DRAFT_1131529 [Hymenopellis radicata]
MLYARKIYSGASAEAVVSVLGAYRLHRSQWERLRVLGVVFKLQGPMGGSANAQIPSSTSELLSWLADEHLRFHALLCVLALSIRKKYQLSDGRSWSSIDSTVQPAPVAFFTAIRAIHVRVPNERTSVDPDE